MRITRKVYQDLSHSIHMDVRRARYFKYCSFGNNNSGTWEDYRFKIRGTDIIIWLTFSHMVDERYVVQLNKYFHDKEIERLFDDCKESKFFTDFVLLNLNFINELFSVRRNADAIWAEELVWPE